MKITIAQLRELGACEDQILIAESVWGQEIPITKKNCLRAAQLHLDIDWVTVHFLPAPARETYEKAIATSWKAYEKATTPAWEAYEKARATAWEAHEKAVATALEAHKKAIAIALYECFKKYGIKNDTP